MIVTPALGQSAYARDGVRTFDGRSNNLANPAWGSAGIGPELQTTCFTVPPCLPIRAMDQAGYEVRLAWPGMYTDITLQAATRLHAPDWTDMPAIGNGMNVDTTIPNLFFRLIKR